jgi:hypothetical protein
MAFKHALALVFNYKILLLHRGATAFGLNALILVCRCCDVSPPRPTLVL